MDTNDLGTSPSQPLVTEDPSVVKGGPLDPTSAEGQGPEGAVVGGSVPAATGTPPAVEEPLYRGLTGDIKSSADLVSYTKQLEDLFVQAKAQQAIIQPTTAAPIPAVPAGPSAKQQFSDLIYSKPDEAFELTVQEAERRINAKKMEADATQRREQAFWSRFYDKNADLKRLEHIVQSVVSGRGAEIQSFRTETEVETFISKETRKIVDLVKKESGHTETVVASGTAVSLGGSREPVPATPQRPAAPINLIDQIRRLRPARK